MLDLPNGFRFPRVGTVLLTHDRAKIMPQGFASFSDHTFGAWELSVADDDSNDETDKLVEAFAVALRQPA